MRGIYKVPMHPVFVALERARKDGASMRDELKAEDGSGEATTEWESYWQTKIDGWVSEVKNEIDGLYKTSKQADEFEEGLSLGYADFSSPINNFLWQIKKRIKYIDKLLDQAYDFEEKLKDSPIKVPPHLLMRDTSPTIHNGDIVNGIKQTGISNRVDNSVTKSNDSVRNAVTASILIGVILWAIYNFTGINLKNFIP